MLAHKIDMTRSICIYVPNWFGRLSKCCEAEEYMIRLVEFSVFDSTTVLPSHSHGSLVSADLWVMDL